MSQAEAWLRLALARFPNDPQILAEAARFEQARGNTARAADFWRASLAAMPPGASAAQRLDTGLVPAGSYTTPQPGDMKRLLDPRNDPAIKSPAATPLPAYIAPATGSSSPLGGPPTSAPQTQPQSNRWSQPASSNPLPLPSEVSPGPMPAGQGTVPNSAPVYGVPQSSIRPQSQTAPVFVAQSSTQKSDPLPLPSSIPTGAYIHTGNQVQPRIRPAPAIRPQLETRSTPAQNHSRLTPKTRNTWAK